MDFSAICRTCIKNNNNTSLNPIFVSEDTHERFSSAIYLCTGVQVKFNDGLPQNMCTICMNQLNNTLKFRKQCKQAETQLLKIKTELELVNSTLVTNEQLSIRITDNYPLMRKQLTTINKSDFRNCLNVKKIKSELNIKAEATEIDIDKHLPLTCKNTSYNTLLKSNDENEINTDTSDTDYFNEETILYNNDLKTENSLQTFDISCEDNAEQLKCVLYSRLPRKNSEHTLSNNEDSETNIPETLSDSNVAEDTKNNIDIPYIVTETLTKKTMRVVCKLCQKELSIRSIDSHMARRHPGADERKVKCELCDKYVMREKLNRHRVMMHGSVGVRCGYCKSEFKSKELLVDHVATCTAKTRKRKVNDSGRALAECDICKMTMQRASLKKHKAVKHAGLRPVCESVLPMNMNNFHYGAANSEIRKKNQLFHTFWHCGKSFGNKFRLNEHYRAKHGYEKFQCSYCDFRSAGIMAMRNHERRHRGEKPFVCETCGAKFHAAYLLMQHKHSHKTEKLVKCDLCPASFKANNNLHMHKLTCHSKSYYSCTLCARSYKCRYYAVKHVKLAHNVSEAPSVIKLMTQ